MHLPAEKDVSRKDHPLLQAHQKLQEAEKLRRSRQLNRAQEICDVLLSRYPDYVGALQTLGLVLADKGNFAQAVTPLSQAAMLNPNDWAVLTALSGVYVRLGAGVMAARTLEQALERKPDDPGVLATLGEIYRNEREYELAADSFRKAARIDASLTASWLGLGMSLMHLGQDAEAASALERVIQLNDHNVHTLYALSQLPASYVTVDILSLIEKLLHQAAPSDENTRAPAYFAQGSALERQGQHSKAWHSLMRANELLWPQHEKAYLRDREFRTSFLARVAGNQILEKELRNDESLPISLFILGPSRSGKTTLERLLSGIDGVKRGYENPIVENSVRRTFQTAGLPTRQNLFEILPSLHALCRNFYIEELNQRAGSAKVFTNTHPGRILDAYSMALVLQNVRLVFVKRQKSDLIYRIFARMFAKGHHYAYSLQSISEYVDWYHRLIDLLSDRLPSITQIVEYEDMIANPERTIDAVGKLCGMPVPMEKMAKLGDDRECAKPFLNYMQVVLGQDSQLL